MRGRYSGFIHIAWAFGGIVGSAGGLQLYALNPIAAWTVCAALGLLAAVLILMPLSRDHAKEP